MHTGFKVLAIVSLYQLRDLLRFLLWIRGGMFVQSMKFIETHSGRNDNVFIFGQESNPDTWKMAKINMVIRGIKANLGVYPKDTFVIDLQV